MKLPCPVTDKGDGTYDGNFETDRAGPYLLHVAVGEEPVEGSPFKLTVAPSGVLEPAHYTATGEGLSHAKAGETASFTVQAKDKYDNAVTVGGDKTLEGVLHHHDDKDATIKCSIHDNNNGTYNLSYKVTVLVFVLSTPVDNSFTTR